MENLDGRFHRKRTHFERLLAVTAFNTLSFGQQEVGELLAHVGANTATLPVLPALFTAVTAPTVPPSLAAHTALMFGMGQQNTLHGGWRPFRLPRHLLGYDVHAGRSFRML